MSLAVHPLGEIMKITGTAILRDYHRANDFQVAAEVTDSGYYHPLYLALPEWHRGLGVLTALLLAARLLWRWSNPRPDLSGRSWEKPLARLVHRLFYVLLLAIVVSGYLISTADGHALQVFGWFDIPALTSGANLEDRAGAVHYFITWLLAFMLALHVAGALKHQFIDKDAILTRMLGFAPGQRN
ncbi:cytochrome b, partial [Thiolapillus sp.]|uniref:cytochrome b n=3 Tax=Thiolapillus sp. TaxID=2017437 RepID=UPI0025FBA8AA